MVAAKRSIGTTDDGSSIVCSMEHKVLWQVLRRTPQYEANPILASQLPAPRCADTIGHEFKIDMSPKSWFWLVQPTHL